MYTIAALLLARIVSPANAQQVIGSVLCCLSVKPVGNFATSMRAPAHSPPARFLSSTDSSSYSLLSPPLSLTIPVSFCSHCSSLLPFVFSLCCRPAMQCHLLLSLYVLYSVQSLPFLSLHRSKQVGSTYRRFSTPSAALRLRTTTPASAPWSASD